MGRRGYRKLGRPTGQRRALLRSMVTSLFRHQKMTLSAAKAAELRRLADRLVSLGKRGDLHSRRLAARYVYDKEVLTKLFDEIAPKYAERPGGYTRVVKLGPRRGDGTEMALIELVE